MSDIVENLQGAISYLKDAVQDATDCYSESCSVEWVAVEVTDTDLDGNIISYHSSAPRYQDDGDPSIKAIVQELETALTKLRELLEQVGGNQEADDTFYDPADYPGQYF